MATVSINGVTYSGYSVSINNGKVVIDGKEVKTDKKVINIEVQGDLKDLRVDACDTIRITGSVQGDVKVSAGDVKCGNVGGSATTMAGNIDCGDVRGNATTMAGNVTRR